MFFLGLDLGQQQDFSALAVVEQGAMPQRFAPVDWRSVSTGEKQPLVVRHLERLRLGTPYLEVARRVAEVARSSALQGPRRLVLDATGVGTPVVEMIKAARPGCEVSPVLITGGANEHHDGRAWCVPKVELLSGLRELLEKGELRIARKLAEAGTLVRELVDVRTRVRASGRMRLGADGFGEHDDLVIAVALACWGARKVEPREQGERLFW